MNYVYRRTEGNRLFTVGFYDPAGQWHSESDWASKKDATEQVHYLNGCGKAALWELAYYRGYEAYTNKNYNNPHSRKSVSYKFWNDGYSAAREECNIE